MEHMEVKTDPDLLVVSLEHCISSEATHLGKRSCIYTTTIPTNSCGHDVLQLATPVQCLGDLNQPLPSIQQHLTQFQPIQYPQVQVSYDSGGLEQSNGNLLTDGASLYQAHPNSTPLNHFNPPPQPPQAHTYHHGGYLTSLPVTAPPLQEYSPLLQPPTHETVQEGLIQYTSHTYSPIALTISAIPPSPPKREEQDVEEPEALPSDDYQYYKEIERFLVANEFPPGASEYYIRSLKKRAKNYLITEGVLHHSPGAPCRVVMTKEEQDMLLKSYHIIESSGTHMGTKQMFARLKTKYFWRGMYADTAAYVGKCIICRDTVPIPPLSNQKQQYDSISQTCKVSISVQTVCRIWSDVEVQVCGPYKATNNRNSYIAIIVDPESKFLLANALPSSGLSTRLTQFILKSLFSFGFARTHIVVDKELYSAVYEEFCRCTKDLHDYHNLLRRRDKPSCGWVASLLTTLVEIKPFRWDKELEKFLYQFRIGELKQFADVYGADGVSTDGTVCPFYSMFQRSPRTFRSGPSQDKENSFTIKSGKPHLLKKNQQHQNDETARGKKSSCSLQHNLKELGEKEFPQKRDGTNLAANTIEIQPSEEISESIKIQEPDNIDDRMRVAIRSIKAFLTETAVYRRRRGRYNKYSDKLRDQMANYALQHGRKKAVKHFSEILGKQINDSTIRNIVKSRAQFGLGLRQKIAKFAVENGVAEAAKHYSTYLNMKISHHLIRRFKSLYGPKKSENKDITKKLRRNVEDLSVKLKADIGRYANENSLEDTINYFKNILGMNLMKSTICELRQDYLQQYTQSEQLQDSTCPSRRSVNEVGSSSPNGSEDLLSQNSFNVTSPEKLVRSCEDSSINNVRIPNDYPQVQSNLSDNSKIVEPPPQKDNLVVPELPEETLSSTVEQHLDLSVKQIETVTGGKKRGKYASFSPEVRADIGRYAAEHGCLKACSHFKNVLGRDLPESTVRGIKEQYLKKLKYSEVTSLNYSPRGRAPLLGKYDKMVQDCLKELIKTGEQPSSFLAILTAKKILSKFEPNLLKENGGDVDLNVSWAKSFIKRLGLRNKS